MITRWRSDESDEATHLLLHPMKLYLDPPSAIGRSPFQSNDSPKTRDRDCRSRGISSSDSYASFYLFKYRFSRRKEAPLNLREIRTVQTPIRVPFEFIAFLMHFRIRGALEIGFWLKEKGEIISWTSILSSKTRNEKPCIWRLIGSFRRLLWVRLCVFILIFHHLVLILQFK